MKMLKLPLIIVLASAAMIATSVVWAHGGHHHHSHAGVGVFIGAPLWPSWYYPPYPYYPYPPVVAVPAVPPDPPVYIERGSDAPSLSNNYWHYCNSSKTYYPYVQQCPEGWQKITPPPP